MSDLDAILFACAGLLFFAVAGLFLYVIYISAKELDDSANLLEQSERDHLKPIKGGMVREK